MFGCVVCGCLVWVDNLIYTRYHSTAGHSQSSLSVIHLLAELNLFGFSDYFASPTETGSDQPLNDTLYKLNSLPATQPTTISLLNDLRHLTKSSTQISDILSLHESKLLTEIEV